MKCGEKCVHLDYAKGICKEWFRAKLIFTVNELPDGTLQKIFTKCDECMAVFDDAVFAEIMRRESSVCRI